MVAMSTLDAACVRSMLERSGSYWAAETGVLRR